MPKFIVLTSKDTKKRIAINVDMISDIVEHDFCCEVYFFEQDTLHVYVTVSESFDDIMYGLKALWNKGV